MENEVVSVIVTAYNEEKNIERCIEALLAQTYKALEIVIIDDGSTDRTWECIQAVAGNANYSRIIIKKIENSGVSYARNTGIKLSSGEWICFCDADDYYYDDAIEQMMDVIKKNGCNFVQGGLCRGGERLISKRLIKIKADALSHILFNYYTNVEGIENGIDIHMRKSIHGPYGKLFRRSILEEKKIWFDNDLRLGEDLLFYFEYLCHVDEAILVCNDVYNVVDNPNSSTRRYNKALKGQSILFMEKAEELFHKYNVCESLKDDYIFQAFMHFTVVTDVFYLNKERRGARVYNEFLSFAQHPLNVKMFPLAYSLLKEQGSSVHRLWLLKMHFFRLYAFITMIKNKNGIY